MIQHLRTACSRRPSWGIVAGGLRHDRRHHQRDDDDGEEDDTGGDQVEGEAFMVLLPRRHTPFPDPPTGPQQPDAADAST